MGITLTTPRTQVWNKSQLLEKLQSFCFKSLINKTDFYLIVLLHFDKPVKDMSELKLLDTQVSSAYKGLLSFLGSNIFFFHMLIKLNSNPLSNIIKLSA